jgi:hypothetical protein
MSQVDHLPVWRGSQAVGVLPVQTVADLKRQAFAGSL